MFWYWEMLTANGMNGVVFALNTALTDAQPIHADFSVQPFIKIGANPGVSDATPIQDCIQEHWKKSQTIVVCRLLCSGQHLRNHGDPEFHQRIAHRPD